MDTTTQNATVQSDVLGKVVERIAAEKAVTPGQLVHVALTTYFTKVMPEYITPVEHRQLLIEINQIYGQISGQSKVRIG